MPSTPVILSNEVIVRSLYEREYERISIEDKSMEADYKDFMSIEIEENISISMKELSPKRNHLSSLSPFSKHESSDDLMSDCSSYGKY